MKQKSCTSLSVLLATASLCTAVRAESLFPTHVVISAEHSGWGIRSTNLTLTLTNGVYAAGTYTVAPTVVSNLLAVARRPWPKPDTNVWPRFTIDLANLGLDDAWVRTNYPRLLEAFSDDSGRVFANASERQRAWLTNALADIGLLGEALRGGFGRFWTDDYPSMELRFENDDGKTVEQVFRLSTKAQPSFMLPWQVYDGTNEFTSGNADISRAVGQLLPPGFLLRDRLHGDLLKMVRDGFMQSQKLHAFIKKSTLEETFRDEADHLPQGFELRNCGISGGSYLRYPDTFRAAIHGTNWPERLTMPVQTGIEHGVVTNLKAILSKADSRVAPLLRQKWVMSRLKTSEKVSVEVKPEGSPDNEGLRSRMEKAELAAFYDRIQPSLARSLGFQLWEGFRRASYWAILEDGRLLLYGFSGDGVLDWKPEELGFEGDRRTLRSFNINRVGVFVDPEGRIVEVAPRERK